MNLFFQVSSNKNQFTIFLTQKITLLLETNKGVIPNGRKILVITYTTYVVVKLNNDLKKTWTGLEPITLRNGAALGAIKQTGCITNPKNDELPVGLIRSIS